MSSHITTMKRLLTLALLSISGILTLPTHGLSSSPLGVVSSTSRTTSLKTQRDFRKHQLDTAPLAFGRERSLPSRSESKSPKSTWRLLFASKEDGDNKSEQPFIRPALHNSLSFRALALLYALLFAIYQSSTVTTATASTNALRKFGKYLVLSPKAAATLHLLSFATWFGTVVYTTFVAGITMFKNLPRRTFGTLQSKLFPLYFQICTGMIGVQVCSFSVFWQ